MKNSSPRSLSHNYLVLTTLSIRRGHAPTISIGLNDVLPLTLQRDVVFAILCWGRKAVYHVQVETVALTIGRGAKPWLRLFLGMWI